MLADQQSMVVPYELGKYLRNFSYWLIIVDLSENIIAT